MAYVKNNQIKIQESKNNQKLRILQWTTLIAHWTKLRSESVKMKPFRTKLKKKNKKIQKREQETSLSEKVLCAFRVRELERKGQRQYWKR